jgi:hypothetical protein
MIDCVFDFLCFFIRYKAIYKEWVLDEETKKLKMIVYWMAPFALGIPVIPVVVGHIMHVFGTGVPGHQIAW